MLILIISILVLNFEGLETNSLPYKWVTLGWIKSRLFREQYPADDWERPRLDVIPFFCSLPGADIFSRSLSLLRRWIE